MSYYAYHLALNEEDVKNTKIAILPGDPWRVNKIAEILDNNFKELEFHREYKSALCNVGGVNVLVISTGIGGPSVSIAMEELARLGIKIFIRVGTTGAIQEYINNGDFIVSTAAVRLDGASTHYAPLEYPAVADWNIVNILYNAAKKLNYRVFTGITASSDTFYPGQERYDTFKGYVIRKFQKSMNEWRNLNVLNFEMESATMFTIANVFGVHAGTVCGVIAKRTDKEEVDMGIIDEVELKLANIIKESIPDLRHLL